MGDTPQQVDWQNDLDFHALPLAEKHKVLLQVDPDYKGLPAKEQAKALDAIHYGTLGQIPGTGSLIQGAGTAFVDTLKGMMPPAPQGPILSKQFWVGDNTIKIHPSQGGIAQMGKEASTEYQRARAARVNPLAAGYSAAISGAGPLAGISDIEQQKLAEQGESGKIVGQSAVPAVAALVPGLAETKVGKAAKLGINRFNRAVKGAPAPVTGLSSEAAGAIGRSIGHATHMPFGGAIGEFIGKRFGTEGAPVAPEPIPFSKVSEGPGPYTGPASAKAVAKAAEAARKGGMTKPPKTAKRAVMPASEMFPGATTSVEPGTGVPQGSPTPFQPISQGTMTKTAPYTEVSGITPPPSPTPVAGNVIRMGTGVGAEELAAKTKGGESGIPTFGKTLYRMGEEPNLTNPDHVKILKVLQTRSGADLRALASQGDRFAAFVLRTMPRP
jgi:hypothetical protein